MDPLQIHPAKVVIWVHVRGRAISVVVARLWNSLPKEFQLVPTLALFWHEVTACFLKLLNCILIHIVLVCI